MGHAIRVAKRTGREKSLIKSIIRCSTLIHLELMGGQLEVIDKERCSKLIEKIEKEISKKEEIDNILF